MWYMLEIDIVLIEVHSVLVLDAGIFFTAFSAMMSLG